MRINIFEEFYSTQELIDRCKKIPFSSTVFIACKSFEDFVRTQKTIYKEAPEIELGFWPILPKSYWISPFSYFSELSDLYTNLSKYRGGSEVKVLLDLELPLLHPSLFLINAPNYRANKLAIEKIFMLNKTGKIRLYTAEYPMPLPIMRWVAAILGVHYPHHHLSHTTITMLYNTTFGKIMKKFFMQKIISCVAKQSHNQIALGLIAPGVFNERNLLSPEALSKEINILNKNGINQVTIYSLAGLDKEYLKVVTDLTSKPSRGQ